MGAGYEGTDTAFVLTMAYHPVAGAASAPFADPADPAPLPSVDNFNANSFDTNHALPLEAVAEVGSPDNAEQDEASPARRVKAIPKPKRTAVKNQHGNFFCTFEGCADEQKEFKRKCEWNKHMDKHDRPYKCHFEACAKLPGFTYSGGLVRHQREVHGMHGGPKNQFACPHPNCKRHSGKGFSRLENLNEHMRRCHTHSKPFAASPSPQAASTPDGASDDGFSETTTMGQKRKRSVSDEGDENELFKRYKKENEELRAQIKHLEENNRMLLHRNLQLEAIAAARSVVPSALDLDDPSEADPANSVDIQTYP